MSTFPNDKCVKFKNKTEKKSQALRIRIAKQTSCVTAHILFQPIHRSVLSFSCAHALFSSYFLLIEKCVLFEFGFKILRSCPFPSHFPYDDACIVCAFMCNKRANHPLLPYYLKHLSSFDKISMRWNHSSLYVSNI